MRPGDHRGNPGRAGNERLVALTARPGSWLTRAGSGICVAFPLTVVAGVQVRGRPAPGQVISRAGRGGWLPCCGTAQISRSRAGPRLPPGFVIRAAADAATSALWVDTRCRRRRRPVRRGYRCPR